LIGVDVEEKERVIEEWRWVVCVRNSKEKRKKWWGGAS